MKRNFKYVFAAFLILTVCFSCKNKTGNTTQEKETKKECKYPAFNGDSAYNFVKQQCDFGARVPGSATHAKCAVFLKETLQKYCDTVFVQDFSATLYNGKTEKGQNIIGSFGLDKTQRIVLAAHWDSRMFADQDPISENRKKPVMGANDGASGVGVLLELARLMQSQHPEVGVDIIFFDLEDQGAPEDEKSVLPSAEDWCLGSQYWAKNKHIPFYQANCGILLDMVGYHEARFLKEGFSMQFAPGVTNKLWDIAARLGYGDIFVNQVSDPIIDDHLFVNRDGNIPMVDIVQKSPTESFFKHWHTIHDDMSVINKNVLEKVGHTLMEFIYCE